jgi:ribulose-phosphate 3-epimerase
MKISASFLEAKDIINDIYKLDKTDVDYLHVDITDGYWVKRKTLSYRKIKQLTSNLSKRLDIHLMVRNPLKYAQKYVALNVAYLTIHLENTINLENTLDYIHKHHIKAGLSIKMDTDIEKLYPYLNKIDLVLLMAVTPGKGGQIMDENIGKRITKLKNQLKKQQLKVEISVDGGVNDKTKEIIKKADILVAGTYILNSSNYQEQIDKLRK